MRTLVPDPPIPARVLTPDSEGKLSDVSAVAEFYVTPHAKDRYLERIGGCKRSESESRIIEIVRAGIEAGRRSKHKPRWLGWNNEKVRNTYPGRVRYVHDEERTMCFLIHERNHKHQPCLFIITCMTRRSA